MWSVIINGYRVSIGTIKRFGNRLWQWLCNTVNMLTATKLQTLKKLLMKGAGIITAS